MISVTYPDLTRLPYPTFNRHVYMDQIRKQWRWHAPNAETGEYTAGRVMGQVNWPFGVDNIFSFTGDEAYLREMPRSDASLTFVNETGRKRSCHS